MSRPAWQFTPGQFGRWAPWVGARTLNEVGVPFGYCLRTQRAVSLDLFNLSTKTTVFSIDGDQDAGKTAMVKTLVPRYMYYQAGRTIGADGVNRPKEFKARILSRKNEKGEPEYQDMIRFLHSKTYDPTKEGVNPLDFKMLKSEAHAVEIAFRFAETVKGSPLSGMEPLVYQIAVSRMWRDTTAQTKRSAGWQSIRDLSSFDMLRLLMRPLDIADAEEYFDSGNEQARTNLEKKLKERPKELAQLNVELSRPHFIDPEEFRKAVSGSVGYIDTLLDGPFGKMFHSDVSAFEMMSDPCAAINLENIPARARPLFEGMLMSFMSEDLPEDMAGTNLDSPITPHIFVDEEQGDDMMRGNVFRADQVSHFVNRARAYHVAWFSIRQNIMQLLKAGGKDDRIRGLNENIDRGTAARFIYHQPRNDDVLNYYTTLGLTDEDADMLPKLQTGECVFHMEGQDTMFLKHVIFESEWSRIKSNSARQDVNNTIPVWKDQAFVERAKSAGLLKVGAQ